MTDDLAALRARVAELERAALDVVGANRESLHESAHGNVNSATIARLTLAVQIDILERILRATTPTPDPRDARIAELEDAVRDACAVTLRHRERATELEAALREIARHDDWGPSIGRFLYGKEAREVALRALGDDHG